MEPLDGAEADFNLAGACGGRITICLCGWKRNEKDGANAPSDMGQLDLMLKDPLLYVYVPLYLEKYE